VPSLQLSLSVAILLSLAGAASAQTADGQTPSSESICDNFSGRAQGLCSAYCEAMDCDSDLPHATPEACERVALQFQGAAGGALPLCVDMDQDGITNALDNCPALANGDQADADADGVGDACDNCPTTPNPDQADLNENGIGDACEPSACPDACVQAIGEFVSHVSSPLHHTEYLICEANEVEFLGMSGPDPDSGLHLDTLSVGGSVSGGVCGYSVHLPFRSFGLRLTNAQGASCAEIAAPVAEQLSPGQTCDITP